MRIVQANRGFGPRKYASSGLPLITFQRGMLAGEGLPTCD
jgi:hypothetical protein